MKDIIKVEVYKLYKKKYILALSFLSLLSLFYGVGVYYHWQVVVIEARLDLITFITSMWSFTLLLAVPIIISLIMTANVVAGEINEGQILLEVTRVKSRVSLIVGKYISIVLIVLGYYLVNLTVSLITYLLFISKTSKGYSDLFTTHYYNFESVCISLSSFLFLIFMITITFCLAINKSVVFATMIGFASYLICMLLGYIDIISQFVPGYFTVVANYHFSFVTFVIQIIEMVAFSLLLLLKATKNFILKEY